MPCLWYTVFPREGPLCCGMLSTLYRHLIVRFLQPSFIRVAVMQVASGTPEQRKVNHSFAANLPAGVTQSKYIFFVTVESSLALLLSWKQSIERRRR
jgi:hypothetical protein